MVALIKPPATRDAVPPARVVISDIIHTVGVCALLLCAHRLSACKLMNTERCQSTLCSRMFASAYLRPPPMTPHRVLLSLCETVQVHSGLIVRCELFFSFVSHPPGASCSFLSFSKGRAGAETQKTAHIKVKLNKQCTKEVRS